MLAWAGVALGLAIGVSFVPRVVTVFGGTRAREPGIGRGAVPVPRRDARPDVRAHRRRARAPGRAGDSPLPRWDRAAGAAVGALGVLVLLWMVIPSLATAKGWPARMARGSAIVAAIQRWAPEQPARFAAWGRAISDAPFPSALGTLQSPPNPGPPPAATIAARGRPRASAPSTVKVTGRRATSIQEGSGWVAAPGLVVTNAHVVAGEHATTVRGRNGPLDARDASIAFDPVRDVAVLDGARAPQRDRCRSSTGPSARSARSTGIPAAARCRPHRTAWATRSSRSGTDIYRTGSSRRNVYVLASRLAPGDSGGALVNLDGNVIGMAFAIDPGRSATAYALTDAEVRTGADAPRQRSTRTRVDTGGCLVS